MTTTSWPGERGAAEAQEHPTPAARPAGEADPRAAPRRRRTAIAVVIGAVAVIAGTSYWLYARRFEDTDDAQVDAYISNISPRVAGTVVEVYVVENQRVKQGDLLVDLDTHDLAAALDLARAQVAQAEAQLRIEHPMVPITEVTNRTTVSTTESDLASAEAAVDQSQHSVDQLAAQLAQAEANDRDAQLNRRRADELLPQGAIPQAEHDQKVAAAEASTANVRALGQALEAARAGVKGQQARLAATQSRLAEARANGPKQLETREASVAWRQASLDAAKAQLAQAELNLSYARIVAPVAGIVGRRGVNVGDRVSPGQELVAITQTGAIWVTANFRETQLERMHPGQRVTVHVDSIGADLHGSVESLGGATGSRYSVLPPENASGNYVKVVQRIPVRIKLDPGQAGMDRLRPGMSVEPKVRL